MRVAFAALIALITVACRDGAADAGVSRTAPVLPAATRAHLDSGNVAFRARDLVSAERHYRESARTSPGLATPWFGLVMVARTQGDSAALRIAQYEVDRLSPGVSTSHPIGGATLPPDHPKVAVDTTPATHQPR